MPRSPARLAGVYGKGSFDDVSAALVKKLAKTDRGRGVLRVLSSMGEEALEEVAGGLVEPALRSLYDHKAPGEHYDADTAAEVAYSALVGGVMGGLGGSVSAVKGLTAPGMAQTAPAEVQSLAAPGMAQEQRHAARYL